LVLKTQIVRKRKQWDKGIFEADRKALEGNRPKGGK